jgi:hypothetical protein
MTATVTLSNEVRTLPTYNKRGNMLLERPLVTKDKPKQYVPLDRSKESFSSFLLLPAYNTIKYQAVVVSRPH